MPFQRKNRQGKRQWYGRITLPSGKKVEKLCANKQQAQEWEVLARTRVESFEKTDTVSLAYLAEKHLDHVLTRLSVKSYDEKRRVFRRLFLAIPPTTPVVEVSYARMEAFLNKISKEKSGHRANKYRVHLVRAYNWGIKALNLPSPNPWAVEKYREDKSPRHVPTQEDFWRVYAVAEGEDQRMLLTYLHTAGRMREIFDLEWDDVDFENRKIRLWTNKRKGGREYNWIPLTDDLTAALQEQRLKTGFGRFVFVNPKTKVNYSWRSGFMKRLCRQAGVKEFGFHAIRHLSASILDKVGVPLAAIQSILRHKSSHTTARYLHDLGSLCQED